MMKRTAFYARVSTGQQEERGTIASQVAVLRERIVQDNGHLDPAHEFIDDGVSGAYLARPELDRLRDQASAGVFEVLYVLSPDRLARRYAHQCVVLEELARAGVSVVFVNQPVSDRPEDRMLIQMLGILAEYEQELIRDRARRGRLYRARQGQVLATTPAYGYDYVSLNQPGGGRWEINEAEAALVRCIYRWCVEEHLSTHAISRRLNGQDQGYERVAPRRGQRWSYTTVNRILRRPDYKGMAYCNRTGKDPDRPIGQPKIHGRGSLKVEPLIWEAVAELLADPQLILNYYLAGHDQNMPTPHELKRVCQELGQIDTHRQRLLDVYLAEVIDLDEFETRRQVLEQQAQALKQRRADLEQLAHQRARQDTLTTNVIQFCEAIRSMLQSPTLQEQQEMLRLVVDHILVEKEQLTIKHVIPLSGDRRLSTQRSATGILPEHASLVTVGCEASGTR